MSAPEAEPKQAAGRIAWSPGAGDAVRLLGLLGSFFLASMLALALTINVGFIESFHNARLSVVLVVLAILHVLRHPRVLAGREFLLYAWLLGYMLLELLWTSDLVLAMNTIIPAANFLLILLLVGSLVVCHNLQAILGGLLAGFLVGAAVYSGSTGFPFARPADFSYNAVAGMYLFGLLVTLLLTQYWRLRTPLFLIAALLLSLIVATTSIKTNLGILLGIVCASLVYRRQILGVIRRNGLRIFLVVGVLVYAAISSQTLSERLEAGANRVQLGIALLQTRENLPGYGAMKTRGQWIADGLRGWTENPVFGHGIEAFRARFGITSHSTPVDLLFNSGLIGLVLFYAVFISLLWRLIRNQKRLPDGLRALIFGGIVCYLFISLSGTMHYNAFMAVFVALSVALLAKGGSSRRRADEPGLGLNA